MKDVTLSRLESSKKGTLGLVQTDSNQYYSIELPDRKNQCSISCILVGIYICEWVTSPKFGECYQVIDVPGRTHILIHAGNVAGDKAQGYKTDSYGCQMFGLRAGFLTYNGLQHRAVLSSKIAIKQFNAEMNKEPFKLEIKAGYLT